MKAEISHSKDSKQQVIYRIFRCSNLIYGEKASYKSFQYKLAQFQMEGFIFTIVKLSPSAGRDFSLFHGSTNDGVGLLL